MMHKAWSSIEEVPYCFSRSSVKFQGHIALKIVKFDSNWAFPDCNSSLNSPMAMKCCTKLETAKKRCPIVFQGHPSNFKVTRDKTSPILTHIGRFRTIGRSQLSNPSDLPCYDKATLDHKATSHCLSQHLSRIDIPYGFTMPLWVKHLIHVAFGACAFMSNLWLNDLMSAIQEQSLVWSLYHIKISRLFKEYGGAVINVSKWCLAVYSVSCVGLDFALTYYGTNLLNKNIRISNLMSMIKLLHNYYRLWIWSLRNHKQMINDNKKINIDDE